VDPLAQWKFDVHVGGGSAVVAESNIVCAMLVDAMGTVVGVVAVGAKTDT
jgi:hypothetical protein